MTRRPEKPSQLSSCKSWQEADDKVCDAFMDHCTELKVWPGDNADGWEFFLAGWRSKESQ